MSPTQATLYLLKYIHVNELNTITHLVHDHPINKKNNRKQESFKQYSEVTELIDNDRHVPTNHNHLDLILN